MPFLPGWARVPARRRSLPRRVPPASAQRGAPAPVASSPPPRARGLPLLLPSLPAPRLHARPPPSPLPPRGERRPPSLVPRALLAAAARAGTAAGPRPTERTHPGTRTRPPGAPPRTPQRLRRAPELGRCDAAHPSPRARHRAPLRAGGSSPGPRWAPSGCGSCPLLGITPEAPAVAAKFPEETRLPAAAQVRKIARGGGRGLFERDGAPRPAGRGLGEHGGAAGSGCRRCPSAAGTTPPLGSGVGGPRVDSRAPAALAPPPGGAGCAPGGSNLPSRGWEGRGLGWSPSPSPRCAPGKAARPARGARLGWLVPAPASHPGTRGLGVRGERQPAGPGAALRSPPTA